MGGKFRTAAVAAAAMAAGGCSSDPAFWEAVAMGLDQAAADLKYQNAHCYWAPPPGIPYGAAQRYCPGDYGYLVYVAPARRHGDRDRGDRHRRDRDKDGDGHRRRDRR
jgi:hypothetical protein